MAAAAKIPGSGGAPEILEGPVAAKIPGGPGQGMDRSMAAFFALPLFGEGFVQALCRLGLGKCEFWLALDEGVGADEQIARLVSVMDGEQADRDEVLTNLDLVQILHGMVSMARAKIMAEIANDLGYGEAASSDPGRAARPWPKAGAPDPGVPSFKKPKVTAATDEVSSLKEEEEKEKIKWAARLKLIADKAGSAAQINSSMGGDLSPEEQSEIKSLVVTKYFLALQDSGCGPAVLPGLRQAIRWICKRLVMTPPDAGDPALEAIVAKVYEERGKELKEAVPVPLKAVAALEYLVNALILADKIPAAIFVWWILILIYASLRWDDGRHVAPSSLTLTRDALVGLVWQTKVERRRKGTRFAVPMCSLGGVTWLEEGWHVFQRFKNDRDFFIWDLVNEGQFDVDHAVEFDDADVVRAQCARVTCHSLRVTLLDAAVHAGADDKVIGLQANWKDPSQLVLKYARSRKELSVRMVQDLATVIRESWTPDQESFVVEDEPEVVAPAAREYVAKATTPSKALVASDFKYHIMDTVINRVGLDMFDFFFHSPTLHGRENGERSLAASMLWCECPVSFVQSSRENVIGVLINGGPPNMVAGLGGNGTWLPAVPTALQGREGDNSRGNASDERLEAATPWGLLWFTGTLIVFLATFGLVDARHCLYDNKPSLQACGRPCASRPDRGSCVSGCLTGRGVSRSCAQCLGSGFDCAMRVCRRQCGQGFTTPTCTTCVRGSCSRSLCAHAGKSAEDFDEDVSEVLAEVAFPLKEELTALTSNETAKTEPHSSEPQERSGGCWEDQSALKSCGTQCYTQPNRKRCATQCLRGRGMSYNCAVCFGDKVDCTIKKCLSKCAANAQSYECKSCVRSKCGRCNSQKSFPLEDEPFFQALLEMVPNQANVTHEASNKEIFP
ncbi:Ubiquitin carboxyl-terminal hydrolase 8 [Durusdinium trenchii]|uniref:Ubiquitin carboxyl-terminal hydrolase 8 n=1 Tax=Durusdinium trenchii TaxID=1381693 RepID=A0ABP0JCC0_9DINO